MLFYLNLDLIESKFAFEYSKIVFVFHLFD
jgi:hypothetical protein